MKILKLFDTTQTDLLKYNGQTFSILRELEVGKEIDREVAPMFEVKFNDGFITAAYADELFNTTIIDIIHDKEYQAIQQLKKDLKLIQVIPTKDQKWEIYCENVYPNKVIGHISTTGLESFNLQIYNIVSNELYKECREELNKIELAFIKVYE